jgi:uroporphyrinogen decarboxylase
VAFPAGGPRISPAVQPERVAELREVDADAAFPWLAEALRLTRAGLGEERALVGFAGAPFTLACYAIEGGGSRDFAAVRAWLYRDPESFGDLLGRISRVVADLLVLQVRSGVDAVQLFDTWGGLLSCPDYREHVSPHVASIVARVHEAGGRLVLFVKDGDHLLEESIDSGADVVAVDWRSDLANVAERLADAGRAVQGNVDPAALLAGPAEVRRRVLEARRDGARGAGHVLNLGHGVLPSTPLQSVAAFMAAATERMPSS